MKILIIEDEEALQNSIIGFLSDEGYVCEAADNYKDAIEKVSLYKYDCVLVDINLPDGSGFDIIKHIKDKGIVTGIIVISARNTLDDRIKGLDTGADDYITKPFSLTELNARIKSLIRRINFKGSNNLQVGMLEIQTDEHEVMVQGKTLELTKKEFDLLMFLVSNQDRVITKETIAEHLWGDYIDMADSFDFVYTHIKNLRKKMQKIGNLKYIKNVYGVGYKFQIG